MFYYKLYHNFIDSGSDSELDNKFIPQEIDYGYDYDDFDWTAKTKIDVGPLDFTDINSNHNYDDFYPEWYIDNSDFIDEVNRSLNFVSSKNYKKVKCKELDDKIYQTFKFKKDSNIRFKTKDVKVKSVTRCDSYRFYPTD